MQVKIYQINSDRDEKRVKYTDIKHLIEYQGSDKINASIYDEVFSGEMDGNNLEDIYTLLNTEGHPLFRGHKLSVSDVVVVEGGAPELVGKIRFYNSSTAFEECEYTDKLRFESEIREALYVGRTIEVDKLQGKGIPTVENGAYFCDKVGFKKVDFDESLTQKPDNLMRIVYVEPHKAPYIAEIENTLEAKQRAVGGLIEPIYNGDGTCLIDNEESKLEGLDGNRRIGDGTSIIAGPFFVCGVTEDNFRGLTDEGVTRYMDRFAEPKDISDEEVQADTGFFVYGMN